MLLPYRLCECRGYATSWDSPLRQELRAAQAKESDTGPVFISLGMVDGCSPCIAFLPLDNKGQEGYFPVTPHHRMALRDLEDHSDHSALLP